MPIYFTIFLLVGLIIFVSHLMFIILIGFSVLCLDIISSVHGKGVDIKLI